VKTVLNLVVLAEPGDVVKGEVSLTVSFELQKDSITVKVKSTFSPFNSSTDGLS